MVDRRIVAPLTARQVEQIACEARAYLGLDPEDRVSMTPLLEQVLYEYIPDYDFQVAEDAEMGDMDGLTDTRRPIITLKNSIYNALQRGEHRARFTAAHEFGHLLLHCRADIGYASSTKRDPLRDPERQADIFAAAFLMPAEAFRRCTTLKEARKKFGVSMDAALCRARRLNHKLGQSRPILTLKEKGVRKPMPRTP